MKMVSLVRLAPIFIGFAYSAASAAETTVDFRRDIRPILNKNCAGCHGGVKQASGVSFIYREAVLGRGKSGAFVVVPGQPEASGLIKRITSSDPDERMPPPDDHPEGLSEEAIAKLTAWVEQGAVWEDHWAYEAPRVAELPEVARAGWARFGVDRFIQARLESESLAPGPEASPEQWLRRVHFDLTGVPPTLEQLDEFLSQPSEEAYERVVDGLLESKAYGERWAALWLDLARYADTQGYEKDLHRDIWLYRDWVIRAFNEDMPFDEFTVKQLAGDLLPNASLDDLVATAFHRNTQTNTEGGTDDEEFRMAAVIDRVNTTWTVWQATTFGCVQCHSHPYEPFKQEEFYRFLAFFNNSEDADLDNDFPRLQVPKERSQHARARDLQSKIEALRSGLNAPGKFLEAEVAWQPVSIHGVSGVPEAVFDVDAEGAEVLVGGTVPQGATYVVEATAKPFTAIRIELLPESDDPSQMPEHGQVLSHFRVEAEGEEIELETVYSERLAGPFDPQESLRKGAAGGGAHPKIWEPVWLVAVAGKRENPSGGRLHFHLNQDVRSSTTKGSIIRRFRLATTDDPRWTRLSAERDDQPLERLRKELKEIESSRLPVMRERSPEATRETRIFRRGNFMDKDRVVARGFPASLHQSDETTLDRLSMARWIVAPDNPLTARVLVNRLWASLFGRGLVETLEDFGSTGTRPSHPALLDWLALRLQNEHGWHLKPFLRELTLSATYRQDHAIAPEVLARDPENRLLSRGPRTRLTAEMFRDQALGVAGLLSPKMYGRSVMPPQPDGVWSVVYSNSKWVTPEGEDRYRRGLYTYWRRTSPYPSFLSFDAPSREVCTARRIATNTPLQALVALNDPVYIEAAQSLARRMLQHGGETLSSQLQLGYRLVTQREPGAKILDRLLALVQDAERSYRADPESSKAMAGTPREAALTLAANTILNLDAALTK